MKIRKINLLNFLALIFVVSFALSGLTSAQEAESESTSKPQSQEETKQPAVKSKPKEKVFKPSEEISEDLPVPFPVDI